LCYYKLRAMRNQDTHKIDNDARLNMFRMYATGSTMKEIAEYYDVTETSVRNYRKKDSWDDRVERIREKAFKKVEKKIVLDTAVTTQNTLGIIQKFKDKLNERLMNIKPSSIPVNLIGQIVAMSEHETELINKLKTIEDTGPVSELSDAKLAMILGDVDE